MDRIPPWVGLTLALIGVALACAPFVALFATGSAGGGW